jgi:hypothetical protein
LHWFYLTLYGSKLERICQHNKSKEGKIKERRRIVMEVTGLGGVTTPETSECSWRK